MGRGHKCFKKRSRTKTRNTFPDGFVMETVLEMKGLGINSSTVIINHIIKKRKHYYNLYQKMNMKKINDTMKENQL